MNVQGVFHDAVRVYLERHGMPEIEVSEFDTLGITAQFRELIDRAPDGGEELCAILNAMLRAGGCPYVVKPARDVS